MLEFDFKARVGTFELHASSSQGAPQMGLFGPSGCGKTTLLHCLAGLLRPDQGYISLGGVTLFDSTAKLCIPPHKRAIGYVFQTDRLFPHMSVRRNIEYGRRSDSHGPDMAELTDVLGLSELLDRPPDALSGGQRQRVALARALAAGPQLLLLDEPIASLDEPARLAIATYLKEVYEQWHVPFVYVSHSLSEILFLCRKAWLMTDGRISRCTEPRDLLAGAGAGLEPILNVLSGIVELSPEHTGYALIRCGEQELKVPGGDLQAGQRVTIALPARDLILSLSHLEGISARNTFPAIVRRMEQNGHALWVTVEADGNPFVVELTEAAGRELGLKPGMTVHVVAKAHSITVTPISERQHHG